MMDARTRVDFKAAKEELDKLDAVAERLMATKPVPMLSAGRFSTYVSYMKRFYRPCTEQGYQRVTNGNKLAAASAGRVGLPDRPASGLASRLACGAQRCAAATGRS